MKLTYAVALGLTTATLATGGITAALAQGTTGTTGGLPLGRDCTTLTLTDGHAVAGFTVPSVCLIRDSSGRRFYLFSGVFRYLAGRKSVQATFPVSNALPLHGSTIVPVVGFVGQEPGQHVRRLGSDQARRPDQHPRTEARLDLHDHDQRADPDRRTRRTLAPVREAPTAGVARADVLKWPGGCR